MSFVDGDFPNHVQDKIDEKYKLKFDPVFLCFVGYESQPSELKQIAVIDTKKKIKPATMSVCSQITGIMKVTGFSHNIFAFMGTNRNLEPEIYMGRFLRDNFCVESFPLIWSSLLFKPSDRGIFTITKDLELVYSSKESFDIIVISGIDRGVHNMKIKTLDTRLPTDAQFCTTTSLGNGTILVSGGYDKYSDKANGFSCVIDIRKDKLVKWSLLVESCYHAESYMLSSGKVLLIGGFSKKAGFLTQCVLYDPGTHQWMLISSLKRARAAPMICAHEDKETGLCYVRVFGGFNHNFPNLPEEGMVLHSNGEVKSHFVIIPDSVLGAVERGLCVRLE